LYSGASINSSHAGEGRLDTELEHGLNHTADGMAENLAKSFVDLSSPSLTFQTAAKLGFDP
jgi:hypothetical protein